MTFLWNLPVGYYPPHPSKEYTEYSAGGKGDYFAELCTDWESAAKLPAEVGVRQVTIRSGAESQRNHDFLIFNKYVSN
jgi:NAD dependent epimerase/dehydratase family enzyme